MPFHAPAATSKFNREWPQTSLNLCFRAASAGAWSRVGIAILQELQGILLMTNMPYGTEYASLNKEK